MATEEVLSRFTRRSPYSPLGSTVDQGAGQPDVRGLPDDGSWRTECQPQELEALEELKKHSAAAGFTDKYLMVFLMARKLDIARSIHLLETNKEWRLKHGFMSPVPFHSLNMDLVRRQYAFSVAGARDKKGRGLLYLIPSNVEPKRYTLEEHRAFLVWLWEFWYQESMDYHRNGLTLIADFSRCGVHNLEYAALRELVAIYQNHFPGRIKQVLLVAPPAFIRFVVRLAKLFVKKKLIQRVKVVPSAAQLQDYVEASHLVQQFTGALPYDHMQWMERMMRVSAVSSNFVDDAPTSALTRFGVTSPNKGKKAQQAAEENEPASALLHASAKF